MDPHLQRMFDACVHCGLCLPACPTYQELGLEADSPRGRLVLMRALLEGRVPLDADVQHHLDLCLGCRACETACPSGVQYGHLLEETRTVARPVLPPGMGFLLQHVVTQPRLMRILLRLGSLLRPLMPRWFPERLGPLWWPLQRRTRAPCQGRVALLGGCWSPMRPGLLQASIAVLNWYGWDVDVHDGPCCGALHRHMGLPEPKFALPSGVDAVLTPAAGCSAHIGAREISDWLSSQPSPARTARPLRIGYKDACHLLHAQRIRTGPRMLLQQWGHTVVDLPSADVCCGGAGVYGMLQSDMSSRLLRRHQEESKLVDVVAVANAGCLLQMDYALHPVEIIAHC